MRDFNPKSGDQPAERIYATRDCATQIHWIDDHKIGVVYIYVQGPETSKIETLLRQKLVHRPSKLILERARDAKLPTADRREALYHLALDKMDRGFDLETFVIYKAAMQDPDPFVRGSAELDSAYLGWARSQSLCARSRPKPNLTSRFAKTPQLLSPVWKNSHQSRRTRNLSMKYAAWLDVATS